MIRRKKLKRVNIFHSIEPPNRPRAGAKFNFTKLLSFLYQVEFRSNAKTRANWRLFKAQLYFDIIHFLFLINKSVPQSYEICPAISITKNCYRR